MQEMRRLRQDATPTDQTQGPLLLMSAVLCPDLQMSDQRALHLG